MQTSAPQSGIGFFHGLGAGIMNFLTTIVESDSRVREDIARHVFRDMFYI